MSHVATAPDGTRIAWTERGSGKPLLLIMGLGASGEVWDLHVEALARDFRCLIVDNRGTGGSDAPRPLFGTSVGRRCGERAR